MALLEVKDLTVRYGGVVALHRLSLQVEAGEIVTLLGANGAGKSTTLRAISGLVPPAGGQIRLDGEEVTRLPAHALVERGWLTCPKDGRSSPPSPSRRT